LHIYMLAGNSQIVQQRASQFTLRRSNPIRKIQQWGKKVRKNGGDEDA
jgi:hypothetical protein